MNDFHNYDDLTKMFILLLQIHLFDIDIPGRMTFKESLTLTAGEIPTVVDTGVMILICFSIVITS